MDKRSPKLRTVSKSKPLYPINSFPKEFPFLLGKELIYILATKQGTKLQGEEWEQIFASCINAEWKPSNVGLDDIVKGNTAWGAKSVRSRNPESQRNVRLISGRNSPFYSFNDAIDVNNDPNFYGKHVLEIWNERVSSIKEHYKHLRTVVLIKSYDLTEVVVFEFDTIRYDPELFYWGWNKNQNLIGKDAKNHVHRFTWQPHGSQFTIIEQVPESRTLIRINKPKAIDKQQTLDMLGVDDSWITVVKS